MVEGDSGAAAQQILAELVEGVHVVEEEPDSAPLLSHKSSGSADPC